MSRTSDSVRDDLATLIQNARQYYNPSFDGVSVLMMSVSTNGLIIRYPDGDEFEVWAVTRKLNAANTNEGAGELPEVSSSD